MKVSSILFFILITSSSACFSYDFIVVYDPPSNIRDKPSGNIYCEVNAVTIHQSSLPINDSKGKKWYPINICGKNGFIHESQARPISGYGDLKFNELKAMAKNGNEAIWERIGFAYYYGNGVEEDPKEAFKWLKKSSNRGLSQTLLGVMYHEGTGVKKDLKKSILWLEKSLNGDAGMAEKSILSIKSRLAGIHCNIITENIRNNENVKVDNSTIKLVKEVLSNKKGNPKKDSSDKINKLEIIVLESCLTAINSIAALKEISDIERVTHIKNNPEEITERNKVSIYSGYWHGKKSTIYISWHDSKNTGGRVEGIVKNDDSGSVLSFIGYNREKGKLFLRATEKDSLFTKEITLNLIKKSSWENSEKSILFSRK